MTVFGLWLCGGLLVISAFFSAFETALLSLPPQELKRLALRTPSLENPIHLWMTRPQKLMVTILVGNTLTDVAFTAGLTWIALQGLPDWPRHAAESLAWASGALTTTLLGEILPKLIGRRRPDLFGWIAFPTLAFFGMIFRPLLMAIETALNPFLRTRAPGTGTELKFSADELLNVLSGSDDSLEISPECLEMMKRTLEINKKSARDIMTPLARIEFIDWERLSEGNASVDLFIERGHTRVPVKKNNEIVGFLYAKDILEAAVRDGPGGVKLAPMVRPIPVIEGSTSVAELLLELENKGIGIALVRGEEGRAAGLITHEDVLEEITGEILDEYES